MLKSLLSENRSLVDDEMSLSTEPLQLDVLIVGCGIAGLAAAVACRLKGFNVTVLESSAEFAHVRRWDHGMKVPLLTQIRIGWGWSPDIVECITYSVRIWNTRSTRSSCNSYEDGCFSQAF